MSIIGPGSTASLLDLVEAKVRAFKQALIADGPDDTVDDWPAEALPPESRAFGIAIFYCLTSVAVFLAVIAFVPVPWW